MKCRGKLFYNSGMDCLHTVHMLNTLKGLKLCENYYYRWHKEDKVMFLVVETTLKC